MEKPITYVGLDVHKDTIAIAVADMGKWGEVREHGRIANTPTALKVLAAKLVRNGHGLRSCYGRRRRASTDPAATAFSDN